MTNADDHVPRCDRCGLPAFNIDRCGDHTGVHRDIEECLHEAARRIRSLESDVAWLKSIVNSERGET